MWRRRTSYKKSIWSSIDDTKIQLNRETLEQAFGAKIKKKGSGSGASASESKTASKKKEKVSLVDVRNFSLFWTILFILLIDL